MFTGIFIVAASYAECDKFYVVIYFTISVAFQGVPGVAINALDLSPNYAGILMGIGGTVTSLTGILVPYIVGVATPNVSTHSHYYSRIFWFYLVLVYLFVYGNFVLFPEVYSMLNRQINDFCGMQTMISAKFLLV